MWKEVVGVCSQAESDDLHPEGVEQAPVFLSKDEESDVICSDIRLKYTESLRMCVRL